MTHKDARKIPRQAQEAIRFKAVKAVLDGMSQTEAARLFGVTRTSVCLWVKAYRAQGEQALETKPHGRPRGGRLSSDQARQIVKSVTGRHPDQLRLPGFLWTRDTVAGLIERRFGLQLSRWTVGRYLKTWGLTPQKPIRRAFERNPAQVRYWLQAKYPAIRRQAKEEGAKVYWGDEMGLRSDHAVGRTWGMKGQTPVVRRTGKRFGCNMISAITNQGELNFMVFAKRFSAPVFIEFLSRMARQNKDNGVFLIVDRHRVHTSRKVEDWISEQKGRIRLFYLPAYSPELNPDELLNQDVKGNALGRTKPSTRDDLVKAVRSYLRSRQRRPKVVRNFFQGRHVLYAAA